MMLATLSLAFIAGAAVVSGWWWLRRPPHTERVSQRLQRL